MTTHKIKSTALKGQTYATLDLSKAQRKLAEVRKSDPKAKILSIPGAR